MYNKVSLKMAHLHAKVAVYKMGRDKVDRLINLKMPNIVCDRKTDGKTE